MNIIDYLHIFSLFTTVIGIFIGIYKPTSFMKYFFIFFLLTFFPLIGLACWNLAIYAVDRILIEHTEPEAYMRIFSIIRKEVIYSGILTFSPMLNSAALAIVTSRAKKAIAKMNG